MYLFLAYKTRLAKSATELKLLDQMIGALGKNMQFCKKRLQPTQV